MSGLFEKVKAAGQSAATQAATIYTQQSERYKASHGEDVTGTPAASEQGSPSQPGRASNFSVNSIRHDLRNAAAQYNPNQSVHTKKLQLVIKSARGVSYDAEAAAREHKTYSKHLYTWGSDQNAQTAADIKDITDRLAWVSYETGLLHDQYAQSLEQSRAALKDIRNFEDKLRMARDKRLDTKKRMDELTAKKADPAKIQALQAELAHLEHNDQASEASVESMKRQKLKECYEVQYSGMKTFGEKMSIMAGYGQLLLDGLEPTSTLHPHPKAYAGYSRTEAIKGQAEQALAAYNPTMPHIRAPTLEAYQESDAASIRPASSFGHTHADALSQISDDDLYQDADHGMPGHFAAGQPSGSSVHSGKTSHPGPPLPARHPADQPSHAGAPQHASNLTQQQSAVLPVSATNYPASAAASNPWSETSSMHNRHPPTSGSQFPDHSLGHSTSSSGSLPPLNFAPASSALPMGSAVAATPMSPPSGIAYPVDPSPPLTGLPHNDPTIAETGRPIIHSDPGPVSGQLRPSVGASHAPSHEHMRASTKEEEARQEVDSNFQRYSGGEAGGSMNSQSGRLPPPAYQDGSNLQ